MNNREEVPKSILKKVSQFDCVSYGCSDGGRTRVKSEKSIRFSFETADGAEVTRKDRHVHTKPKKKRSSVGGNRASPATDVAGNEVLKKSTVTGNGDGTSTRKAPRKDANRKEREEVNAHLMDPFHIVTGRQNVETRGETDDDPAGKKATSTEKMTAGSATGIQMKTEETDDQKRQGNRRRKKRRRKRRRGRG